MNERGAPIGYLVQSNSESNHDLSTDKMEKVLEGDLSDKSSVGNVWIGQTDSGCNIAIVTVNPLDSVLERELSHIRAVLDVWGEIVYTNETEAKSQPALPDISTFDWFKSKLGIEPAQKQIKFVVELSDTQPEFSNWGLNRSEPQNEKNEIINQE